MKASQQVCEEISKGTVSRIKTCLFLYTALLHFMRENLESWWEAL